jgi:hypothetical protein
VTHYEPAVIRATRRAIAEHMDATGTDVATVASLSHRLGISRHLLMHAASGCAQLAVHTDYAARRPTTIWRRDLAAEWRGCAASLRLADALARYSIDIGARVP